MDSSSLFLPEILLIASIMVIPALHIFTENRRSYSICSNVSLVGAFVFLVLSWYYPESLSMDRNVSTYIFYDHFKVDAFSQLFKIVFVLTALIVSVVSTSYFDESEPHQPEYFTLLISSTLGMMVVASANDFLTLFLGIEISAFSSYAMVAFRKKDDKSTEAGAKYLLIGAFSSALTLYGISLIYAVTGYLTFDGVHSFVDGLNNGVIEARSYYLV